MEPVKLTLPLPPTVNTYWRSIVRGKHALPILSREAREYKARMLTYAVNAKPLVGPCKLTARFFRPRRAGDVDGRIKPLLDALQGIAFLNDAQLVELHAYNDLDPNAPRVEVEVEAVS